MNKQTIAAASALMSLSLVVVVMVGACGGMEHEASIQQPCEAEGHEYVVLSATALEDKMQERLLAGPAVEADLKQGLLASQKLGTVADGEAAVEAEEALVAEEALDAEASLEANLKLEAVLRIDAEATEQDKSLEGAGKVEVQDSGVAEVDLDASLKNNEPRLSGPDPRVDAEQSLQDNLKGRLPSPESLNQGHAAFDDPSDQDDSDPDDFDKAPEYNDNIKTND